MKLLAIPALLAGVAQAIQFLNDIPVGAYYDPGTEFVLEWKPEDRTDTFQLTITSFLTDPILVNPGQSQFPVYDFKEMDIVLDGWSRTYLHRFQNLLYISNCYKSIRSCKVLRGELHLAGRAHRWSHGRRLLL